MRIAVVALSVALAVAGCQSTRTVGREGASPDATRGDSFESDEGNRDSFEAGDRGARDRQADGAVKRSFETDGASTASPTDPTMAVDEKAAALPSILIDEAWVSDDFLPDELDSMASHRNRKGEMVLFVTAKEGHHLRVLDAATGKARGTLGARGDSPGAFNRPNGIVVVDGLIFVAERDAHRVQVLDAETGAALGTLGEEQLTSPYGLYVERVSANNYRLFVTDSYRNADGSTPPDAALDRRVQDFAIALVDGRLDAKPVRHFGATEGEATLHIVESISGDPKHGRILIAEEDARNGQFLRVYDYAGKPRGEVVGRGVYAYQPEGIALFACGDEGYWITSDQHPAGQRFHVFDRESLKHLGSFRGKTVRNTDGLWIEQSKFGPFEHGALFAQHDDRSVVAFDWTRIAGALGLKPECAAR